MKFLVALFLVFTAVNINTSETGSEKYSPRLQKSLTELSSLDTTLSLWLNLDVNKISKTEIILSEKSLQRRKKVNAVNYLIDEKDSTFSLALIDSIINSGAEIKHILYWFDAVTVKVSADKLPALATLPFVKEIDVVRKIKSHRVFQVEPLKDLNIRPQKSLALPYGFSQFQTQYIKADKLHDAGLSGKGVRIAMFDTGFNTGHRAFDSANIISTFNFIDNIVDVTQIDCENSVPQSSHGTMTFGIVGGYVPDTLIGVAYNAEFLLAKTEITCGSVEIVQEEDNWIAAAQWADQQGADIISSSLGYITFQDTVLGFSGYTFADLDGDIPRITAAADIAASKNILVINSAGNERGSSWNHIITPADGDSVIAVGATTPDSNFAGFSSPGPSADGRIKPDITTLGVQVFSSYFTGGYTAGNGTSFSAPLVAGAAALAFEHDFTLTADDLRDLIRRSGDQADSPDNDFGYGLFDAVKTADIVSFLKPHTFSIAQTGESRFFVETAGRSNIVPILSILDTIPSVLFTDNGDGTGFINVTLSADLKAIQAVRITADVGYFADTTEFIILSEELLQGKLVVGPNPCSDFLQIYFFDPANFQSLTIHKVSGKKVWELFNNYTVNADINRIEARWNCNNQSGEVVADGVYIVVVSAGGEQFYQKVLKVK